MARKTPQWQMGKDGRPEHASTGAAVPTYAMPTPEEQQAAIMRRAATFVVTLKPNTARHPTIAQAAAQAAAWAADGGKRPLIYALAEDGASALVPERMWRDALTRACLSMEAGETPADVIAAIGLDYSLIGRLGSHKGAA